MVISNQLELPSVLRLLFNASIFLPVAPVCRITLLATVEDGTNTVKRFADVIAIPTVRDGTADLGVRNPGAHIILDGRICRGWSDRVLGSVVFGYAFSVKPRARFSVLADLLSGNAKASAHHQLAGTISAKCASRGFLALLVISDSLAPGFVGGKCGHGSGDGGGRESLCGGRSGN